MRTIIVIFTDHKVPVHEIPNFKKNTSFYVTMTSLVSMI